MADDKQIARARRMRREPTLAERALWRILRGRQFGSCKFRRQVPLGPFIVDFLCLERRLIVECDGGQHADSAYDERRDAWLKSQGFIVLRLWNTDVLNEGEAVQRRIEGALGDTSPSPSPR